MILLWITVTSSAWSHRGTGVREATFTKSVDWPVPPPAPSEGGGRIECGLEEDGSNAGMDAVVRGVYFDATRTGNVRVEAYMEHMAGDDFDSAVTRLRKDGFSEWGQ